MNVSKPDFLLLNLAGIDMFVGLIDEMVKANAGSTFEQCARYLQNQIHQYGKTRDAFNAQPTHAALPAPLTMTLAQLMDRGTCRNRLYLAAGRNVVYIIRDGNRVLYIGSTHYGARKRLKSHEKAHSPLGQALRKDPNRDNWSVEMIPHADYESAASKEKELIAQLMPAFCRRF